MLSLMGKNEVPNQIIEEQSQELKGSDFFPPLYVNLLEVKYFLRLSQEEFFFTFKNKTVLNPPSSQNLIKIRTV